MAKNMIKYEHRVKWIFILLLLCYFYSMSYTVHAEINRIYSLGWEDYSPYQFKDDLGRVTGLDIDLVRAIMEISEMPIRMKEVPWKRHLEEIKSGRIDMASGAARTPERESYAYFSEAYRTGSAALYIRKKDIGKWKLEKLEDIAGTTFNLCITRGYYYGDSFSALKNDAGFINRINEVTNESQCFLMLKKGNVDGFIADPMSATANLRQENMLDDVSILMSIYADESYVMFSKKSVSPEIVQQFNKNLTELKRTGTYYKILEKYMRIEPDPENRSKTEKQSLKKYYIDKSVVPIRIIPKEKASPEAVAAFEMMVLNRYLKEDNNDINVLRLQIILKNLGIYKGVLNGNFSPEITSIIRSLQMQHNLIPDGIVGPLTYRLIGNYL